MKCEHCSNSCAELRLIARDRYRLVVCSTTGKQFQYPETIKPGSEPMDQYVLKKFCSYAFLTVVVFSVHMGLVGICQLADVEGKLGNSIPEILVVSNPIGSYYVVCTPIVFVLFVAGALVGLSSGTNSLRVAKLSVWHFAPRVVMDPVEEMMVRAITAGPTQKWAIAFLVTCVSCGIVLLVTCRLLLLTAAVMLLVIYAANRYSELVWNQAVSSFLDPSHRVGQRSTISPFSIGDTEDSVAVTAEDIAIGKVASTVANGSV